MKETIIFAPGISGTELLRSLARYGINTLGCRVFHSADLAGTALMKSGIAVTERFLPRKEEPSVIASFLKTIPYFQHASYADAESIAAALFTLRSLIPAQETERIRELLPKGEFPEKNEALFRAYDKYLETLAAAGRIDTVGMIRKALAEAAPLNTEILTLKEFPLSPLEQTLAAQLAGSGNGKDAGSRNGTDSGSETETGTGTGAAACGVREISLRELFQAEAKPLRKLTFTESYGASNEVRDILSYIFQNNIPLDRCTVAVTETISYAELFYELSAEYGIPVSFGCGLPVTVSNPARLLKLYQDWNGSGFRGIDALTALLTSSAFDRERLRAQFPAANVNVRDLWTKLAKAVGNLRLSGKVEDNRRKLADYRHLLENTKYPREKDREEALYILSCMEVLAHEMEQGPAYLIQSYTRIREGNAGPVDRSAVTVITDMIEAYLQYSGNDDIDELIPEVLNKTVSSGNSREGCLHVCSISGAMAVPREYLFVAGLSASNFPGSPTENYLLLDTDLKLFGSGPQIPVSDARVFRKKEALRQLLELASALELNVRLSYSSYELAELKDENPSSALHEIFRQVWPEKEQVKDAFENTFRHVGFFEDRISRHTELGNAYIRGDRILTEEEGGTAVAPAATASEAADPSENTGAAEAQDFAAALAVPAAPKPLSERSWSPTAIDVYFDCPKKFYLSNVLGIKEPETDDPFEVINAKDNGSLAHSLMMELGERHSAKDVFLKHAEKAFDDFLIQRPPVHSDDAVRQKKQFLRMMEKAWEQDPGRDILLSEEKKYAEHPSGVRLYGIPDRVEKTEDGKYLIVDFKTGRRISHQQDDITTCLQVLIYAFMMEQEGLEIAGCEYRYLRHQKTISCKYDETMKNALQERLTQFQEALVSGDFPCAPSEDNCRYCKLNMLCGKEKEEAANASSENTGAAGEEAGNE